MMKKLFFSLLALFLMSSWLMATPVTMTYTGGHGNDAIAGAWIGSYSFNINVGGQNSSTSLWCDDFAGEIYAGESWQSEMTTENFSSGGGDSRHQRVGWILQEDWGKNLYSYQNRILQGAIWQLSYGSDITSGKDQQDVNDYLKNVVDPNYRGFTGSLDVFTPRSWSSNMPRPQEVVRVPLLHRSLNLRLLFFLDLE